MSKHFFKSHHAMFMAAIIFLSLGVSSILYARPQVSRAAASQHSFIYDAKVGANYEIYLYGSNHNSVKLTNNPVYDSWWPKVSPDGQKVLFYRTPAGVHDTDYTQTSLWTMNIDGSNEQEIISNGENGWQLQGHGEWSPDSNRILMFAGTGGALIVHTDTAGGDIQLVQTNGQWLNTDPSWSPDGNWVIYTYQGEIWRVPTIADGSNPVRLTNDALGDYDPYYSPDGSKIAFLTKTSDNPAPLGTWAIRAMDPNGDNLHTIIDDGNINSKPNWSPDGLLIYFHRYVFGDVNETFNVWSVRPDGTGLTKVTTNKEWSEYPQTISYITPTPPPSDPEAPPALPDPSDPQTSPSATNFTPTSTSSAGNETSSKNVSNSSSRAVGAADTTGAVAGKTAQSIGNIGIPNKPNAESILSASKNIKNDRKNKLTLGIAAFTLGIGALIAGFIFKKHHDHNIANKLPTITISPR